MEIQLDTEGCSDGVFEGALAQGASAAFHVIGYLVDTRGCPEAGHMETQLDTEGCLGGGLARLRSMPGSVGRPLGLCGLWPVRAVYQTCSEIR